jgi:hypothetical protein
MTRDNPAIVINQDRVHKSKLGHGSCNLRHLIIRMRAGVILVRDHMIDRDIFDIKSSVLVILEVPFNFGCAPFRRLSAHECARAGARQKPL